MNKSGFSYVVEGVSYWCETGTFSHNGLEIDVNQLFILAAHKNTVRLSLSKLQWNLNDSGLTEEDEQRIRDADITCPLIVVCDSVYGYVVADGTHRLFKHVREKSRSIPVKILDFYPDPKYNLIAESIPLVLTSQVCTDDEKQAHVTNVI